MRRHLLLKSILNMRRYRQFLEWDIVKHPTSVRLLDRALSPALGKSIVFYARKQSA